MGVRKAKIKLPELQTKRVWVGCYGGHYENVVIFKSKPVLAKELHRIEGKYYCLADNSKLIIGETHPQTFKELYPDIPFIEPSGIEITKIFPLDLQAFYDPDGYLSCWFQIR